MYKNRGEVVCILTARELEILKYLCLGLNNKEIGTYLFISTHTVKVHVSSIIHKLNAKNRTHAVFLATSQKIIDSTLRIM